MPAPGVLDGYPAVAQSHARALATAQNRDMPAVELVAALESDVGLTIAVLRAARDRSTAAIDPVASVRRAVDDLGRDGVVEVIGCLPTFDLLTRSPRGAVAPHSFALHALAVRRAASLVASRIALDRGAELATAALLHDVGKLALAELEPGLSDQVSAAALTPEERVDYERRRFGTDHAAVGADLIRRWRLPEPLADAIEHHHAPEAQGDAACLRLADLLANYEQGRRIDVIQVQAAGLAVGIGRDALADLMYELIRPAARAPHDGACPLTPRELEVLRELAAGRVYKQIADGFGLSVSTVRNHLHNAYKKLEAVDRTQAVLFAAERGWL